MRKSYQSIRLLDSRKIEYGACALSIESGHAIFDTDSECYAQIAATLRQPIPPKPKRKPCGSARADVEEEL